MSLLYFNALAKKKSPCGLFDYKVVDELKRFFLKYEIKTDQDQDDFLFDDKKTGFETIDVWEEYERQGSQLFRKWEQLKDQIVFEGKLLLIRVPFIPYCTDDSTLYDQIYIQNRRSTKITVSQLLVHCDTVLSGRYFRNIKALENLKIPTIDIV